MKDKTMTNIFDLINQKKAQLDNRKETIKPKQGNNVYIILPSWRKPNEPQEFWKQYAKHWIKNETGELQAVTACNKAHGQHCPVCEALALAENAYRNDPVMEKIIKEAKATDRFLFNVLDVSAGGTINPQKVEVLDVTKSTAQEILGVISGLQQQGISDPVDLHSIYPIQIVRSGQGMQNTTYSVRLTIRPVQFDESAIATIKENLKNLDDFVADDPNNEVKALTSIKAVTGGMLGLPQTTPSVAMIAGATNNTNVVTPVVNTLSEPVIDDFIPTFDTPTAEVVNTQPAFVQPTQTVQQTQPVFTQPVQAQPVQMETQNVSGNVVVDANQLNDMLQGL